MFSRKRRTAEFESEIKESRNLVSKFSNSILDSLLANFGFREGFLIAINELISGRRLAAGYRSNSVVDSANSIAIPLLEF